MTTTIGPTSWGADANSPALFEAAETTGGWDDRDIVGDFWQAFGPDGLPALTALVERVLEDDGVTYTPVGGDLDRAGAIGPQRWPLDPIPLVIDGPDWTRLEAGLVQRARLLDAIVTDVYGPMNLIRAGLLPAPLVFRHDQYLRPAHGVVIPGATQLFFHAVDVTRTPGGDFVALGDRAQAPSGSGYAMADRRVMTKVLPEIFRRVGPRGLSTFFHTVLGCLQGLAPLSAVNPESPRVVVLSPGTHSETAFDQAFLASLLGLPLVESADLTVRRGQLFMRALGRYEPVDVVVRRVDAAWSDPLDLRPDSELGVVGLLEACRRGSVTVVNSLGSGVVENPGLLPFLPALSRELLGEELSLPSVETVWCGDPEGLRWVLAHLEDLVIKPIGRGPAWMPATMPTVAREVLRQRILASPETWVGQRRAAFGLATVVSGHRLARRRVALRTFAVAGPSGWSVLPGGLGRVLADPSADATTAVVAAKDVWVRSSHPDRVGTVRQDDLGPLAIAVDMAASASPRVLEDLFWLGRYAERTEDLVRLLTVTRETFDAFRFRPGDARSGAVATLLQAMSEVSGADIVLDEADPRPALRRLVLDPTMAGTVAQSFAGLQETARAVRDQLSSDTWMVLAGVDRAMSELAGSPADAGTQFQATGAAVLSGMLAFSGLASENMVRDPGWYLMDIGRRLERALQLASLLAETLVTVHSPDVDPIVIDTVLTAAESVVTYRRRYSGRTQVGTVLELLMLDAGNPRSLAYQVITLAEDLRALPGASGTSRPERLAEELVALVRRARPEELDDVTDGRRPELADFLGQLQDGLRHLSDAVATQHFWRSRPMLPLGPVLPAGRAVR